MDEKAYLRKALWGVVCAAILIAAAIWIWEFCFGLAGKVGVESPSLRLELMKILWQFLLLAVLGGALGLFFKSEERKAGEQADRERREEELRAARREKLLSTRGQLIEAYNQAKAVRRLLRALARGGSSSHETLIKAEYTPLMRQLIDVQLKMEYYAESIEADTVIFGERKSIARHLDAAQEYLNQVVAEFEDAWEQFAGQEYAPLSRFGNLQEFIQPLPKSEETRFGKEFKKPFREALKAIESEANTAWKRHVPPKPPPNPGPQPDVTAGAVPRLGPKR
jgi:hypothetical protein